MLQQTGSKVKLAKAVAPLERYIPYVAHNSNCLATALVVPQIKNKS